MNDNEVTELLRLIYFFEDLFDGTLGDWYTDPVKLKIKLGSKPFNG